MSNIPYLNQSAPFWDFVAHMEDGGSFPPWSNTRGGQHGETRSFAFPAVPEGTPGFFPWTANIPHHNRSVTPPPAPLAGDNSGAPVEPAGDHPQPGNSDSSDHTSDDPSQRPPPPPPAGEGHRRGGRHGRRHHEHDPGHHGPGPFGYGHRRHGSGPLHGGRGPHRGRGGYRDCHDIHRDVHHNSWDIPSQFSAFAAGIPGLHSFFGMPEPTPADPANTSTSFVPDVDVFDTPENFVVHVSLPGARKEDLNVSWDSEKSELAVTGVVHRPGDEALLRHLALGERHVGELERKVRLGSRAKPAQVDADAITARMEDGILRINVPKLDAGYVEIHQIDVD